MTVALFQPSPPSDPLTGPGAPIPEIGSIGNAITADVSFMLKATPNTNTLDAANIDVYIKYNAADTPRPVFLAGKVQENFNGVLRVFGTNSGGADNVKITFGHAAKFYFNSEVTITVTGMEGTPAPVPYTVPYTFQTTALSSVFPRSSTVPDDKPANDFMAVHRTLPENSPVDKNISFHLNAGGPTGLMRPRSVGVTVTWPPAFVDTVIQQSGIDAGLPNPASLFNVQRDDTVSNYPGYQFSLKDGNLPYSTIVTVTITPSTFLPDSLDFLGTQVFSFKTENSPVTLDGFSSAAIDDIQQKYKTIKDDGAISVVTKTGSNITITQGGDLVDLDADFGESPPDGDVFDTYAGGTIQIFGSAHAPNNRTTTIIERNNKDDPGTPKKKTLRLDSKTLPFFFTTLTGYTLTTKVVRGSNSIQASSPGLSGMEDQTKSATNAIFLAMQDWARRVAGFRHVFNTRNLQTTSQRLTGSFTVTNGSPLITGSGTFLLKDVPVGSSIVFSTGPFLPFFFIVQSVSSDYQLQLTSNYTGSVNTTLSGSIDDVVTTIPVVSTATYPPLGIIQIGSEQITYTALTLTSFLGCTRGTGGTTAASHFATTAVIAPTSGLSCTLLNTNWARGPSHEISAAITTDPTNRALEVCSFNPPTASDGIGFMLSTPIGANGFNIQLKGRADTFTTSPPASPTAYIGWTLYYRAIPNNGAVGAWTAMPLNNMALTSNLYTYSTPQAVIFGGMVADTLYQCELVRNAPVASPSVTTAFYLLEVLIDFS